MRKVLLAIAVLNLLSFPSLAQDRLEVFGGYQYLHIGGVSGSNPNPWLINGEGFNGWNVAATANLTRYFGIEGNFGGAYNTINNVDLKVYHYAGGPVVFAHVGRLKPFAHVLFGGIHLGASVPPGISASTNGYTIMAGGGIDAKVNRLLAIRVGEVDWLYYNLGSTTANGESIPGVSGSNNVRFSTGIVLRF
ncbi:MAG: hypothetical protein WAK13_09890 [Terriglobales bacterium]